MCRDPGSEAAAPEQPGVFEVLLVTESPEAIEWASADGASFHLSVARALSEAASRLRTVPADVVVLDPRLASADEAQLSRLRESLGRAGLLVRTDGYAADIAELLERLGDAACVLPADAPAPVQARLVALAAERSRLQTQLVEHLHELEQSRSRFRDIIERNADAIVVVDREGVIRFGNSMAAKLFRSRREDLPGTPFGFPMVAGETTELDLLHPDRYRTVEMRVVESEWEGETAYIASLRDITERKQAEEDARRLVREQGARAAAEASARRFRFLAEATALLSLPLDDTETLSTLARLCADELADWAVIYVTDENGFVQRLEVAHRDPEKAQAVRVLRERPIRSEGPHPVLQVLRTRSPLLIPSVDEEGLVTIAQDEVHLELIRELGVESFMLVPLVARGRELGAIGLVSADPRRRFTEEELAQANDLALRAALAVDNARLYREAQEANQAKSNLLAVISHDLRTPLNSIIGHADLLAMGIQDVLSEGGMQWVARIRMAAKHLLYLIDELLSFARLEAGRDELRLEDVDAATVAAEAAAVIEPLALERGLDFHLDVPEEPVQVRTDPDRLRQILLNLLGNAIKYTEQGEVRLELRRTAENGAVFQVHDTGIGIRPEHLGKVFEPFWQADPSQRGASGGTGLGLGVVRGLVGLLGGEVAVESEVGRGSTFTVRLPRRVEG